MTIHALYPQQDAGTAADSSEGAATAYDSVWAGEQQPAATAQPLPEEEGSVLEQTMLSNDKLYVVLAVVLLIWLGVTFLLFRTDRRLSRLERRLKDPK